MRHKICFVFILFVLIHSPLSGQTTRPVADIKQALVVSVDGLRPDVLLRAKAPTIRNLMKEGSFTFWAQTTAMSVTLPSHTSMLTGVTPQRHGITWNSDLPLKHPIYPGFPTLFEVAKRAGYSTAMAAGKIKFDALAKPGTIDFCYLPPNGLTTDDDVAMAAVKIIHEQKPGVFFVHFPGPDSTGHQKGWGTEEQLKSVENVDACLKRVLDAYTEEKLLSSTVVLLTADHGGAGNNHGPDDPRSRHIPWIISGPGIRKNLDLTIDEKLKITIEDSFATICYLLGIPMADHLDGKPVKQILQ